MASLSKGTLGPAHPDAAETIPVQSSFVQSFAFTPIGGGYGNLRVAFKNGAERQHVYVTVGQWTELKTAPSKGRAYNALIKNKSASMPIIDKTVGRHHANTKDKRPRPIKAKPA